MNKAKIKLVSFPKVDEEFVLLLLSRVLPFHAHAR